MGPVANVVNTHFAASTPNFLILEYTPDDTHPARTWSASPWSVKDGYLPIPDKPGWGIEISFTAYERLESLFHFLAAAPTASALLGVFRARPGRRAKNAAQVAELLLRRVILASRPTSSWMS